MESTPIQTTALSFKKQNEGTNNLSELNIMIM
jgi:hypothetical protein